MDGWVGGSTFWYMHPCMFMCVSCTPAASTCRATVSNVPHPQCLPRAPACPLLPLTPPTPMPALPQVAGLDVGWGQQLAMQPDRRYPHRFVLERELPPGQYQFKFIIVSGLGLGFASLFPWYQLKFVGSSSL